MGEIIVNNNENNTISASHIKEITGLDVPVNHYIIQCTWTTYDSDDHMLAVKVVD